MKKYSIVLIVLSVIFQFSCKEEEEEHPEIQTVEVIATSAVNVTLKGSVSTNGNIPIVDYGFIYSFIETDMDVNSGTKVSLGKTPKEGIFTAEVSTVSLPATWGASILRARAYLTNQKGTVYGQVLQLQMPEVQILTVSPLQGKSGDKITVTGTNFSSKIADFTVKFNEAPAKVLEVNKEKIIVEVPTNVSRDYYYSSNSKITVAIAGKSYTATEAFSVIPTFTDFFPKGGSIGSTIFIKGTNLKSSSLSVLLGDQYREVTYISDSTISVTVPSNITSDKLRVSIILNSITTELLGEFDILPPTIASFSPVQGPVGTQVVVTGSNFSTAWGSNFNTVKVGDVQVEVTMASSTSISFVVPASLSAGNYKISVFNGIHLVTSLEDFQVVLPTIADFSPKTGPPGTEVIITGTNFSPNNYYNTVLFGTHSAYVHESNSNSMKVYVPLEVSAGAMKINLRIGEQTVTSEANFTVLAPKITSFSPASGTPGSHVTITGQGFSLIEQNNIVDFDAIPTTVLEATATSLVVLVPSGTKVGAMKISVTVAGRSSTSTQDFTVVQ